MSAVLAKGREYEAIQASEISLKSMYAHPVTSSIAAVSKTGACSNCGLHHAVRACPAYHMECSACGIKGHWKKCCHKTKGHPDPQDVHQPKYRGKKWCSKSNTTRSQKGTRSQDEIEVSADEGEEYT